MAVYDTAFMENVTNPVDIMVGVGDVLGNDHLIGYLILLSFFLIFAILTMRHDFNEVLIINGFLTTLLAVLLYGVELVPGYAIIWPAIILFLALIFYMISK